MPGSRPDWKSYRLKPKTVLLLRVVRRATSRTYLTYDELLTALVLNFLLRRRTLRGLVNDLLVKEGSSLAEYRDAALP